MVTHNQGDGIQDANKSISQNSMSLLSQLETMSIKASQLIPQVYNSLKNDGLSPEEARDMIEQRISISQRRLRELLPLEAKNPNMTRPPRRISPQNNARLVVEEVPKIPAPEQPIIEPELEPTPQELAEQAAFNQTVREEVIQTQIRKHEEAFMPLPLADQLNKFLLARMIGMARSNGDDKIKFKINNEGDLYVPA